jgi:hypothetical protein
MHTQEIFPAAELSARAISAKEPRTLAERTLARRCSRCKHLRHTREEEKTERLFPEPQPVIVVLWVITRANRSHHFPMRAFPPARTSAKIVGHRPSPGDFGSIASKRVGSSHISQAHHPGIVRRPVASRIPEAPVKMVVACAAA